MPPETFVTTEAWCPHTLQWWRYVLSIGGSTATQRLSLFFGGEGGGGRAGQSVRGSGQSLTQWPSWPHRKHGAGLGQSAARCPTSLQLPRSKAAGL